MRPNKVVFSNDGEIDVVSLSIMGLSVKEGKTPFGFFGTGLKYSVAILLRLGLEVRIYSGESVYTFKKVGVNFRGVGFDQIVMIDSDGTETILPFTASYGINWTLDDVFRELYCNAMDEENGEVSLLDEDEDVACVAGKTFIVVSGDEMVEVYNRRDEIILNKEKLELVWADDTLEAYKGGTQHIYYRGVRVATTSDMNQYTYNILSPLTLTENRTVAYIWQVSTVIARSVGKSEEEAFVRGVLNSEGFSEKRIDWSDVTELSETFALTAEKMRRTGKLSSNARNMFSKARSAFSSGGYEDPTMVKPMPEEQATIDAALEKLRVAGLLLNDNDMSVTVHDGLDRCQLSSDGKTILISLDDAQESVDKLAEELLYVVASSFGDRSKALINVVLHGVWPDSGKSKVEEGF